MNSKMHLAVISAEGEIFSGIVQFVVLPGQEGDIGVYPHHAPLMAKLRPGVARFLREGEQEEESIFVAGGLLEIQPTGVTVLADTAVRGSELDEEKALEAKRLAEEALQRCQKGQGDSAQYLRAQGELVVAAAKIAALRQLAKRRAR